MQPGHYRSTLLRLLALCAVNGPVCAVVQENLDEMRQIAQEHVEFVLGSGVEVEVSRPDPRLHLARCDAPLEVFEQGRPLSVGNNTLGVRCSGTSPWTVYLSARVSRSVPVLVTNRPLGLGHVITADDIALISQDQARLRQDTLSDPSQVIGQVVARPLNAGAPLTTHHIQQATVVKRGEQVTIRAGSRHFAVEAPGKALADGTPGSRIRVENLRSKRIVEGVVGPDRVIDVAL
jgi:flagellar basal body P-ring formation protein FlgA